LAAGLYNIIVVCIALLAITLAANLAPYAWILLFCTVVLYLTTTLFFLVFFPKFKALYMHDTEFMRHLGLDDDEMRDAKSAVQASPRASSTSVNPSTRSSMATPKNKNASSLQLTEAEATSKQLDKTRGDLERLIRRMEKDKDDLKKEYAQINKLKEQLVHLTEHQEFLVANPDQGKSPARTQSSSSGQRESISAFPNSPSENKTIQTELTLIGKNQPSSSIGSSGELNPEA